MEQQLIAEFVPLINAEYTRIGFTEEDLRSLGSGGELTRDRFEASLAELRSIPSNIGAPAYFARHGVHVPRSQNPLAWGLRFLLALIGGAAFFSGLAVAATEIRVATLGSPLIPTLIAAIASLVIALGGALLIRAAVRGYITVRRTSAGRRKSQLGNHDPRR